MATPRELAALSRLSYVDGTVVPPIGYEVFGRMETEGDEGYFGVAFRNLKTNEIILAHRGTNDFTSDIWADDFNIAVQMIPAQFEESKSFVDRIKIKMAAEGLNPASLQHTGHSLGGALAQLHAAVEHTLGSTAGPTVVFESPGVDLRMLREAAGAEWEFSDLRITNFVAAPNLVNTTGSHFADVVPLDIPADVPASAGINILADYALFSVDQHSIDKIATHGFDAATGTPLIRPEPGPWPEGIREGFRRFRSYAANRDYWDAYFDAKGYDERRPRFIIERFLDRSDTEDGKTGAEPTLPDLADDFDSAGIAAGIPDETERNPDDAVEMSGAETFPEPTQPPFDESTLEAGVKLYYNPWEIPNDQLYEFRPSWFRSVSPADPGPYEWAPPGSADFDYKARRAQYDPALDHDNPFMRSYHQAMRILEHQHKLPPELRPKPKKYEWAPPGSANFALYARRAEYDPAPVSYFRNSHDHRSLMQTPG